MFFTGVLVLAINLGDMSKAEAVQLLQRLSVDTAVDMDEYKSGLEALDVLGKSNQDDDARQVLMRLAIARDNPLRVEAIRVAIRSEDARTNDAIIPLVIRAANAFGVEREGAALRETEYEQIPFLVFLAEVTPQFVERAASKGEVISAIIKHCATDFPLLEPRVKDAVLRAVFEAGIDRDLKRSAGLSALGQMKFGDVSWIMACFKSEDLPVLRTLLRLEDGTLRYSAAQVLAALGDSSIKPVLLEERNKLPAQGGSRGPLIDWFLQQIDLQATPARLLDAVRNDFSLTVEQRLWAARRALDLGLSRTDVERAIRAYLERALDAKANRGANRSERTLFERLAREASLIQ